MQWIVSLPERLDAFLGTEERMLSRGKAQRAIEEGHVKVNEQIIKKSSHRLQEGDKVLVSDTDALLQIADSRSEILPVDLHLEVLYEDTACMVIHKPAGISVHPGAGIGPDEPTILNGIAFLFADRSLPFSADSALAHRLDKETTGCLLIAKTPEAHIALQKQFADRTIDKRYLALVAGIPSPAAATIDAPIGRSTSNRTKMAILGASASREAQTTYRTFAAKDHAALLECELHTGRTHQVRVHLSSIGHPVLGDPTYTSELSERLAQQYDIRNLCLHAWKLNFRSPRSNTQERVLAPIPNVFQAVLQRVHITVPR